MERMGQRVGVSRGTVGMRLADAQSCIGEGAVIARRAELRVTFRKAARTLTAMRLAATDRPARELRSGWPDVVRTAAEVFAVQVDATPEQLREMRADRNRIAAVPTPAEISRMDEVLGWLLKLGDDERRVVFALALRIPARKIAEWLHCSRPTVWRIENRALDRVASLTEKC